jgi:2-C-methyl-D-erythritol 4-phosphate cytidylyltransferase
MPRFFALVPAAGSGTRLGGGLPKQYLELAGRPLLYHSVARLCSHAGIEQAFVVLAPGDARFRSIDWGPHAGKVQPLYCGGDTRAASVFNGLLAVRDAVAAGDWMLVHDAARPCLGATELDRLMTDLAEDETGGLLAMPAADTLKRGNRDARVVRTEPRDGLWQAQTPQMFRYRLLVEALRAADPAAVTDEAAAIERLGLKPRLVMGSARNLKVTYREDVALAELVLKSLSPQDARRT